MKSLKVALAVLLLATPLNAQTVQLVSPISGVVDQPECGEPVALIGFVHGTLTQTASAKDQNILYVTQNGPRGDAYAVGLDSGIKYNLVGNTMHTFSSDSNFLKSLTIVNNFKIVGLYSVKYDLHVLLNEDGSISSFVEKARASCK